MGKARRKPQKVDRKQSEAKSRVSLEKQVRGRGAKVAPKMLKAGAEGEGRKAAPKMLKAGAEGAGQGCTGRTKS